MNRFKQEISIFAKYFKRKVNNEKEFYSTINFNNKHNNRIFFRFMRQ